MAATSTNDTAPQIRKGEPVNILRKLFRLIATHRHRVRLSLCAAMLVAEMLLPAPAMALIGARLDHARHYDAVVTLVIGQSTRCSATKIAAHRFLTAAHCVADTSSGVAAAGLTPGSGIHLSNLPAPGGPADFLRLHVERVHLPPVLEHALERLFAYQQDLIRKYKNTYTGAELERRVRAVESQRQATTGNHFTERFPDIAVVQVRERTPAIPLAHIDFGTLVANESVVLVGYGCEQLPPATIGDKARAPGRRKWGDTQVIRVDPVNFYSFAHRMRAGAPSTCPGDSGGPVMRAGKVVGVHGKVYGLARQHGARSNMSVNLQTVQPWLAPLSANSKP